MKSRGDIVRALTKVKKKWIVALLQRSFFMEQTALFLREIIVIRGCMEKRDWNIDR